jgi:hypothetical protein
MPSPDFEILSAAGQGPSYHLPVTVKSLSATGVILEVRYPPGGLDLRELQGRSSVVHLPLTGNGREMAIPGKVVWTRPQVGNDPLFLLGLELENPTLEVRQALEEQLPIAAKDIKELWDQWDQTRKQPRSSVSSPQGIYLVGMGVVLGGLGMQLFGPEGVKGLGFIMVLYGCATLLVKSLWSLWRQRGNDKNEGRAALQKQADNSRP